VPTPSPAVAFEQEEWSAHERSVFAALDTPAKIQAFLDATPYNGDPVYRSPRSVIAGRKAHCVDGALFAATALRRLGYPPMVIDLKAEDDDDHVIAVFRHHGRWGAVSKSNFPLLRFREPIYRNIRELALTYFEFYYSLDHAKTLRQYSRPLDLRAYDGERWMTRDERIEDTIVARLYTIRHFDFYDPERLTLEPTDPWTFKAGIVGANMDEYHPPTSKPKG
jgi:hypothetical protein